MSWYLNHYQYKTLVNNYLIVNYTLKAQNEKNQVRKMYPKGSRLRQKLKPIELKTTSYVFFGYIIYFKGKLKFPILLNIFGYTTFEKCYILCNFIFVTFCNKEQKTQLSLMDIQTIRINGQANV